MVITGPCTLGSLLETIFREMLLTIVVFETCVLGVLISLIILIVKQLTCQTHKSVQITKFAKTQSKQRIQKQSKQHYEKAILALNHTIAA